MTVQDIDYPKVNTLTADEINSLADRLFSRGISVLATDRPEQKSDLITASRALRELLRLYDRATGRSLHAIMLNGGMQ
jgi:hypothetical protein